MFSEIKYKEEHKTFLKRKATNKQNEHLILIDSINKNKHQLLINIYELKMKLYLVKFREIM